MSVSRNTVAGDVNERENDAKDQLRLGRKIFKAYQTAADDSAQVEDATQLTGFIHGCNFFLAEEL